MRRDQQTLTQDLIDVLLELVCEQTVLLGQLDWHDPEQVTLAEKRGRIIQVHRGNVEKTIGMDDKQRDQQKANIPERSAEEIREEFERRLLRHAQALGTDELIRRVRARGADPDAVRLGLLGEAGPEGADG